MRSERSVLVWLGLLLILAVAAPCTLGQISDGPYFVVDAAITAASGQVFPTIAAALENITNLGPQGWGATLMINPGVYPQSPGLVIAVRGLTIVSRDGPEKTQLGPTGGIAAGTPLIVVAAPHVTLKGLKLAPLGGPAVVGISVEANDCQLADLVLTGLGAGGIATLGVDRLSILNARISGTVGTGITIGAGSRDVVISQSEIRGSALNGIALTDCTNGMVSENQIVANGGTGVAAGGCEGLVIRQNVMSGNAAGAIALGTGSLLCEVSNNHLENNPGVGIAVTNSMRSLISSNDLNGNSGGGIIDVGTPALGSVGNQILNNQITAQQGTVAVAAGISLSGNVRGGRAEGNTLVGNGVGITLVGVPVGPAGCTVLGNTVSRSSTNGIHIAGTNGGNVFANNTISESNQAGILIAATPPPAGSPSDVFRLNSSTGDGQAGIRVTAAAAAKPVVILESNTVSLSGGHGIEVSAVSALPVAIINSVIRECGGNGILVSAASPALRFEGNELAVNRLSGLNVVGAPTVCAVHGNNIHGNHGVGVALTTGTGSTVTISHNAIWANRQGGVQLLGPAPKAPAGLYLSDNDISGNLGYGLSAWPGGFVAPSQAGANWWGDTTGPSGLFAGRGNAILGLPADGLRAAPILPAPVSSGPGEDAVPILDAAKSQVALIPSFAAQKVIVNRLDTTLLRLVFSGVSDKDSAWVNTAPFTKQALQMPTFSGLGQVVSAAAVLVAGVTEGNVEIGFGFDPSVLPAGADLGKLRIYVYLDGAWKASSSGEWTLEGGAWKAIDTCSVSGGEIVIGSTGVADLTGRTKAIALVLEP